MASCLPRTSFAANSCRGRLAKTNESGLLGKVLSSVGAKLMYSQNGNVFPQLFHDTFCVVKVKVESFAMREKVSS